TFLPYIGLVIAIAGAMSILFQTEIARRAWIKPALACAILLVLGTSGFATFQRNKVWQTEETLWRDVTIKSPQNGRGLMNYGNTLMTKGDYGGALDYFHRALGVAPQYPGLFVHLARCGCSIHQSTLA